MTGFRAVLMGFLDKELTVIVPTNQNLTRVEELALRIVAFYSPDLGRFPGD